MKFIFAILCIFGAGMFLQSKLAEWDFFYPIFLQNIFSPCYMKEIPYLVAIASLSSIIFKISSSSSEANLLPSAIVNLSSAVLVV